MDAPLHRKRCRQGLPTALHGSCLHPDRGGVALKQVSAVLLDIEGTTTPIDFVHKTLFGYARSRVAGFLERRWNDAEVQTDIARLRAEHAAEIEVSRPPWRDEAGAVAALVHWLMDRDRKSTGLKSLQGKIWEEGYRSGELKGEVYPDVPPALERWQSQAIDIAIFSSGSVPAQKSLFRSTAAGDLTRFICAYFDTTTGPKKEPQSYARIAQALGCSPSEVRFISDVVAELDAARAAGMQTTLCVRNPGAAPLAGAHAVIHNFDRLPMRYSPAPAEIAPTKPIPPETSAAVSAWMRGHGWQVTPARWQRDPEMGFCVWQEEALAAGRSHGLWVDEAMVRRLSADQLVQVLDRERVAEEIRINYKVRIEERGAEYRVSVVPRRSGEFRRME